MRNYLKSNMYGALISYFLIMFLVASLVAAILASIISNFYDIPYIDLINASTKLSIDERTNVFSAKIFSFSSFVSYTMLIIFVPFYSRDLLLLDYKEVKVNKWKYIIITLIMAALFYGFSELLEEIAIWLKASDSQNQESIVNMFNNGYLILTFISVVIFGPIVEEIVYRKIIFKVFEKYKNIIPLIFSSVLFMLAHMSGDNGGFVNWLIICIPYLGSGLALGGMYLLSKKNIYPVIIVHIINNLISFILIIT